MKIILGIIVCTIINLAFYKIFNTFWGGYVCGMIVMIVMRFILES